MRRNVDSASRRRKALRRYPMPSNCTVDCRVGPDRGVAPSRVDDVEAAVIEQPMHANAIVEGPSGLRPHGSRLRSPGILPALQRNTGVKVAQIRRSVEARMLVPERLCAVAGPTCRCLLPRPRRPGRQWRPARIQRPAKRPWSLSKRPDSGQRSLLPWRYGPQPDPPGTARHGHP